jgi:hypothetical protein
VKKLIVFLFFIFGVAQLHALVMGLFFLNKGDGSIACFGVGNNQENIIKALACDPASAEILRQYKLHIARPHHAPDQNQQYSMGSMMSKYLGDHGWWAVRTAWVNGRCDVSLGAGYDRADAIKDADQQMGLRGIARENIDPEPYAVGQF